MTIVSESPGTPVGFRFDAWTALFLAVLAALFAYLYTSYPVSPAMDPPDGDWFGWWDQSQYLKSAQALARGDLSPDSHWYPLGYSLLAVPFVGLLPRHPFLIVNLAATLVFAWAYLIYFRPVIGYWPAVAAFFASLLVPAVIWLPWEVDLPYLLQFVIPWNSVPVAAAFMVIIVLMRSLRSKRSGWPDFAIGALTALVAITRPIDVVPLVPIAILYLWRRLTPDFRWRNVAIGFGGILAVIVPTVLLMLAIYGGLSTPYSELGTSIGLSVADIPFKAFIVLLDAEPVGGPLSLFQVNPLFYMALPLALAWAVVDRHNGLVPVLMSLCAIATYLAYNDFSPANMFVFYLVHYIVWAFPVLFAAGVAGLFVLIRQRRHVALAVAVVLAPILLASLTLREVVLPAKVETRAEGNGTRYLVTLSRPRTVDAIDFRRITSVQHPTQVPLYETDFRADDVPLARFKGYRAVPLAKSTRFLLTGSAHARTFEVVLDDTFVGQVKAKGNGKGKVRPVVFKLALKWPWETLADVRWKRKK